MYMDIEQVKKTGIKSRFAIYNIIQACTSTTQIISLEEGISRWKKEMQTIFKIDRQAKYIFCNTNTSLSQIFRQ